MEALLLMIIDMDRSGDSIVLVVVVELVLSGTEVDEVVLVAVVVVVVSGMLVVGDSVVSARVGISVGCM